MKLFGLVNKKNKIPKFQLYIAYFALLNKLPKYEENSDFGCIRENAREQLCTILENNQCIDECNDGQTNG